MDGEHAFSAAIVLCMVNISFQPNSRDKAAMELALQVLKGMGDRGNEHIKARHQLLSNLRSMASSSSDRTDSSHSSELADVLSYAPDLHPDAHFTATLPTDLTVDDMNSIPFSMFNNNGPLDNMPISEDTVGDTLLIEEAYGGVDVNMDFDLAHFAEAAQNPDCDLGYGFAFP